MSSEEPSRRSSRTWRALFAAVGGLAGALGCFLLLPLLRAITAPPKADLELRRAETVELPPPPPPEEEKDEPEQEEEPPPPEASAEAPPLDLSDLELVLNGGGFNDGAGAFAGGLPLQLPAQRR